MIALECTTDEHCYGGFADTCTAGKCRCGKNDKCLYPNFCSFGECKGNQYIALRRLKLYVKPNKKTTF